MTSNLCIACSEDAQRL